jgi:poly(3-hydroxyalkanoate) synthetase
VAKECPEDPQEWLRHAENGHGSWWPDYASWLAGRCGEERAAPAELGGGGLEPLGAAPGTYVHDR